MTTFYNHLGQVYNPYEYNQNNNSKITLINSFISLMCNL